MSSQGGRHRVPAPRVGVPLRRYERRHECFGSRGPIRGWLGRGASFHGFTNRFTMVEPDQQAACFGQGKEQPDLPIDDARLQLRAGLPTRDRFFGRAQQRGEIALVEAELRSPGTNLFGLQQTDLLPQGPVDLMPGVVVENHLAAGGAGGQFKIANDDLIGPAVVVDRGRVRRFDPIDLLLAAVAAAPGEGPVYCPFGSCHVDLVGG
jgi:hypothetical protein